MIPRIEPVQPMLTRAPFHGDSYVYEEKLDGWRIVVYKRADRVRLVSRTRRHHARTGPAGRTTFDRACILEPAL